MELHHTLQLQDKLDDEELAHYLIADYHPDTAHDLYAYGASPDIAPLYIGTDLAELLEYSPYVIRVKSDDTLLNIFHTKAISGGSWSGILVSALAEIAFDDLITHLRQRLIMQFSGNKKGILHFQNPAVAHYFFGESDKRDTALWMGPITHISWYAFPYSAIQGVWCSVSNSLPVKAAELLSDTSNSSWIITPSQQMALEIQYDDKILSRFFESISVAVTDNTEWCNYRQCLNQAESLGLTDNTCIYRYLTLCRQYGKPAESLLKSSYLFSLTSSEKLQYLENTLRKDSLYVS